MKIREMKIMKSAMIGICVIVGVALGQPAFAQAAYRDLAEDEILYEGHTKLEKCDSVIVSFVLNSKENIARNFSIELTGIHVKETNGSVTDITLKSIFDVKAKVKEGVLDYSYSFNNQSWQITIRQGLGSSLATGEIRCDYALSSISSDRQFKISGTAPVQFNKIR